MQGPPEANKPAGARKPFPELVGATSAPIVLTEKIVTVSFPVHAPTGPAALRPDGSPRRVILSVENVSGHGAFPNFGVYLNLPPGVAPESRPDLYALTISTFGLREPPNPNAEHGALGFDFRQDVTALYLRLIAAQDWDSQALRVSIVPVMWEFGPFQLHVGRVSLMME